MLEQCILGFLNYMPMTGYEIKGHMENSTSHFMFAEFRQHLSCPSPAGKKEMY